MSQQNVKTATHESKETSLTDLGLASEQGSEIIPSVAIDRILAARAEGLKTYFEGARLLIEAREMFSSLTKKNSIYCFEQAVSTALLWDKYPERAEKAIKKLIDTRIWHNLMTDTGMYTLMSTKQRDEWDRQLDSEAMPEITLDNVEATFRQLGASKNATFEQGIIDVFRGLSWDYKTNNPCQIGKKIILSSLLDVSRCYVTCSTRTLNRIDDLTRVFHLMDGKNVPDFRVSDGVAFDDFFKQHGFTGAVYEGEYFTVKYFKKGSGHIVFKRPELVEKLNDLVARHYPSMLPPRV
jgi:hypothetical protein